MRHVVLMCLAPLAAAAAGAQANVGDPAPPGDGITRQGTNPEGQPCTPAGYNLGLAVYPACIAMGGPAPGIAEYPPCTRRIADRCTQTYTRWTQRR